MRLVELLQFALLFSTASAGWNDAVAALNDEVAFLMRRQESSSKFDLSFTGVQGNTATTQTSSADESSSSGDSTATSTGDSTQTTDDSTQTSGSDSTGTATGSQQTSGSGTAKQTGTGKTTGTATTTQTFDARLPAGGVSMITPNALTSQYFKIANYVTFAWNYTSLSVTPSAVDVLASCSTNQATYTIALNQTVQQTQTVVWDTGAYQANATVPLLTGTYTLIIHDAAKDVSATAMAGYLGTYEQFTFGMYAPQVYTPRNDYICATCSSALSLAERQTLWAIFGMVAVTVFSFGWFTGVTGLW